MSRYHRRRFLCRVGQGMFVASVGYGMASDLGIANLLAKEIESDNRLHFGSREPLVALLQETPPEKLLAAVVRKINDGTSLEDIAAAAALANARAFGGEDYVGFHTLMALGPAYGMHRELPAERRALALLKVIYRNGSRIEAHGGREAEVLQAVQPADSSAVAITPDALRELVRQRETDQAEQMLAAMTGQSPEAGYSSLFNVVQDSVDVHRIVLAHRAWDMLELVGRENATSMFRQSLRYCLEAERKRKSSDHRRARQVLPGLLDEYKLLGREEGTRGGDDAWVDQLSQTMFRGTPDEAAEAAAAALADGYSMAAVGEAIALAANQLVLRDAGRQGDQVQPGKPAGSVHGDSAGVHACDTVHAWRGIARVTERRDSIAATLLSAFEVALDCKARGGAFLDWEPRPYEDDLRRLKTDNPQELLQQLDGAIREQNQSAACAAMHRYGELDGKPRAAFDVLLRYAVSEEGALHAEKFYRTASDEFAEARPAFRWRHAVALARVTASQYGQQAAGYEDACGLLGVEA